MEDAQLPTTVKTVGKHAFSYCSKLQTAGTALGSHLERIDVGAFENTVLKSF